MYSITYMNLERFIFFVNYVDLDFFLKLANYNQNLFLLLLCWKVFAPGLQTVLVYFCCFDCLYLILIFGQHLKVYHTGLQHSSAANHVASVVIQKGCKADPESITWYSSCPFVSEVMDSAPFYLLIIVLEALMEENSLFKRAVYPWSYAVVKSVWKFFKYNFKGKLFFLLWLDSMDETKMCFNYHSISFGC